MAAQGVRFLLDFVPAPGGRWPLLRTVAAGTAPTKSALSLLAGAPHGGTEAIGMGCASLPTGVLGEPWTAPATVPFDLPLLTPPSLSSALLFLSTPGLAGGMTTPDASLFSDVPFRGGRSSRFEGFEDFDDDFVEDDDDDDDDDFIAPPHPSRTPLATNSRQLRA